MSSQENLPAQVASTSSSPPVGSTRQRNVARACDKCRRKKARCDGAEMPGNRCSNCVALGAECTYFQPALNRHPKKGEVEALEKRVKELEDLLVKLSREGLVSDAQLANNEGTVSTMPASSDTLPVKPANIPLRLRRTTLDEDEQLALSDDEFTQETLTDAMQNLEIDPIHQSFFGKSSDVALVHQAYQTRFNPDGVDGLDQPYGKIPKDYLALGAKRPQFWVTHSWDVARQDEGPLFEFPPDELLQELVENYFANDNTIFPVLHRPSFQLSVTEGLHYRDRSFAGVVLLVCAIGARYSEDPRVLPDGEASSLSKGWKYYRQMENTRWSRLMSPRLYDLQQHCLAVIFVMYSSASQSTWTMISIGLRLAQDVGAHRRKMYTKMGTVDDEQWKRCFWVLVCLDRFISSAIGRPCAIHDEDFDIDMPLDCDDEFWVTGDPETDFKQPTGRPSAVSAFIYNIRLSQIVAFALRTVYSISKSRALHGLVGPNWEQRIVAELTSALDKWREALPPHLCWDPDQANRTFLAQSGHLNALYHHLQILIHVPFIPSPNKPSPLPLPPLEICVNAAKSANDILDVVRRRCAVPVQCSQALFSAGIVMMMSIWTGHQDPTSGIPEVHKCLESLRACESRILFSGRQYDTISLMLWMSQLPTLDPLEAEGFDELHRATGSPVADASPSSTNPISPKAFTVPTYFQEDTPTPPRDDGLFEDMPIHERMTMPRYPWQDDFWSGSDAPVGAATPSTISGLDSILPSDPRLFGSLYEGGTLASHCSVPRHAVSGASAEAQMWSSAPWGFRTDDWSTFVSQMAPTSANPQAQEDAIP